LRLLSDLCHTSLDALGGGVIRHRRGVQQVHGFGSSQLSGYTTLGVGPPTLVGGSRETPSFLFASECKHAESYCPHGSEAPGLKWCWQGGKSPPLSAWLRQSAEKALYDTVPVLRQTALESSYRNTLYVASRVENKGDLVRVCRLVPKLNLQIHGGACFPLIHGATLLRHGTCA
jgi:hypothetical protein